MGKYRKSVVLSILLALMVFFILIFNHYTNIIINISHSNCEIDLRYKIPNPEDVKDVRLTYKLHFLDNYKNVAPSETTLSLNDSSSEVTLKVDPSWFLGKKDQIEFALEITYRNGKHKKNTATYSDFLNDFSNDLCIEPEIINDFSIYDINGIYAKISLVDLPDNIVIFKSYSNPKEVFYIGFKYNSYLYPIKEYQILSKSDFLNGAVDEFFGTIISFSNESRSEDKVLLYKEYIDHPWGGLFPFDENGELIEFINENPDSLNFFSYNEVAKVYQNSIDKYSEYFQFLSEVEFYYKD
jgi:hypothetical protein